MNFYHDEKNVKEYAAMCEGYNASAKLDILYKKLPDKAPLLELGSGPGNDLELLAAHYEVTGSDYSPVFVEMLKACFFDISILLIDAVTIATEQVFDAICSNKILHHLNDEELSTSFVRQADILSSGGFVFHLVWQQLEAPKEDFGLNFMKRDFTAMKKAMDNSFEIIETKEFGEFENGDRVAILARKI